MKYYLIAGEASGDLHASHLMSELLRRDPQAQFRCVGGDLMQAQGATLVRHYRDLAYMGILPVLCHLHTILKGMEECKRDILTWQPNALILVDYPGFNLRMARFVHTHTRIPVYYYISPKIWAWKEHRIHDIRRYVDLMLSILPFEVDFYERKHHFPIHYVGNPTMDEVDAYLHAHPADEESFRRDNGLDERPIIALLAGSRRQEIRDNLPRMVGAALPLAAEGYQMAVAVAPGIPDEFYHEVLARQYHRLTAEHRLTLVHNQTFRLLQHTTAALVTSGTATLETALFRVPQVVCYYMWAGRVASLARRLILKIPYVSLVNLVAGEQVVPELIAEQMNVPNVEHHLRDILPGGSCRQAQQEGYERMAHRLGAPGAPAHAASLIVERLAHPERK